VQSASQNIVNDRKAPSFPGATNDLITLTAGRPNYDEIIARTNICECEEWMGVLPAPTEVDS
jgi:hypothetical protein